MSWGKGPLPARGKGPPGLKEQRNGAFLTTWQAGPTLGFWADLASVGVPVLKFQVGDRFPLPPDWETVDPDAEAEFRAPAMKRALRHLRRGNDVVIPADRYQWSRRVATAACLVRRAALSTAIAALAPLSGVQDLPVFAWWSASGRARNHGF